MRRLALALDDTQVMRDRDRQAEIDRQRGREEENEERESVREGRDRDRVSLESLPFQIVRSHTVSHFAFDKIIDIPKTLSSD